MVTLLSRPAPPPRDQTRTRVPVVTGVAAAAIAAAVGLAVVSAVTVLVWALGPHANQGATAAPFRGAASLWLMAQFAPVQTPAGELQLAPLGLSVAVAVLIGRLASWAARRSGALELRSTAAVVAGVVLGHAGLAAVAATFSSGGSGVDLRDAVPAAALFALPCAATGAARHTWAWARVAARYGPDIHATARAAGVGALVLLVGGAVLLFGSLGWHHRQTGALFDATGGGAGGTAGMLLLCLALLPNAALWVVAVGAGPGFALGTDAGLGIGGMDGGALPALPLLAALPASGPLPLVGFAPVLLPVAAGAAVGWLAHAAERGRRAELGLAGLAALACGLGVGALAGLSGGGVGGRLDSFGPNGVTVALMLGVEVTATALLVVGARAGYQRWRTWEPAATVGCSQQTSSLPDTAESPDTAEPESPAAARDGGNDGEDLDDDGDTQEIPVVRATDSED